jgi:hypothetical protein
MADSDHSSIKIQEATLAEEKTVGEFGLYTSFVLLADSHEWLLSGSALTRLTC